jgi:ClpP class serine protease
MLAKISKTAKKRAVKKNVSTRSHKRSPTGGGAKPKAKRPKEQPASLAPEKKPSPPSGGKPKKKVGLALNWNRAIHINRTIDDALLKELTPVILGMKQDSSDPITVGIDSPGGSIAAVESLLGLLSPPIKTGIG